MKGSTFKERFDRWKNGESYWDIIDKPLNGYKSGKDSITTPWDYKQKLNYKYGENLANDYDYAGYAMKYPEESQEA